MKIVDFSKIDKNKWDDFCMQSKTAWFRHTTRWIKFAEDLNNDNLNLSFGVFKDNELLAIAPLFAEPVYENDGQMQFGLAGMGAPFPAVIDSISDTMKEEVLKMIFKEIDDIASRHKIVYSHFFIDPLSNMDYESNPLLKFGFEDTSLTTNIVDLSLEGDDILRNMRKGHRSDVNFALKNDDWKVSIFSKENISDSIFEEYKNIYFSAAGKKVGNDKRWENTLNFIKDGYANLIMLKVKDNYISGTVVLTYKDRSYYFISATLPDFQSERGVGQLIQWETMNYLKKTGIKYYETGWNFTATISEDVYSPKEINISLFKSGFGGEKLPFFRGENFYNSDFTKKRKLQLEEKFKNYYGK